MIRTTKQLNNLILKVSGGRISGTVLYGEACWDPGRLNQGVWGRCPSLFILAGAVMKQRPIIKAGRLKNMFEQSYLTVLAL